MPTIQITGLINYSSFLFWSGLEKGYHQWVWSQWGSQLQACKLFYFPSIKRCGYCIVYNDIFTEASSETKVVVINGSKTSMIADQNQKEKGQDERVWEILQAHRFKILQRCFIFTSVWREAIVEQNPKPLRLTSNRTRSNFLSECICSFFSKHLYDSQSTLTLTEQKKVRNTKWFKSLRKKNRKSDFLGGFWTSKHLESFWIWQIKRR